jgi:hypothetical protein
MATVNNRVKRPQAVVINGVDNGGLMTARITAGFDQVLKTPFDGLSVPVRDKFVQFCRGDVTTQDFATAYSLMTGTLGTYVFYERKSGVAAASGWIKHTIKNPVIHKIAISINKDGYSTVSFSFECQAASETEGVAALWVPTDSQSEPTYIEASRGGFRIVSITHGVVSIYHNMALEFSLAGILTKESNDSDVGYTCVEIDTPYDISGSLSFQDGSIATSLLKAQSLLLAEAAELEVTVRSSSGAADKVITIANVDFDSMSSDSSADATFTGYQLSFGIANDPDVPLTLVGTNKIITFA